MKEMAMKIFDSTIKLFDVIHALEMWCVHKCPSSFFKWFKLLILIDFILYTHLQAYICKRGIFNILKICAKFHTDDNSLRGSRKEKLLG